MFHKAVNELLLLGSVLPFSKSNNFFGGFFDPECFFFYIMKINIFRGELTDISAKKEALVRLCNNAPLLTSHSCVGLIDDVFKSYKIFMGKNIFSCNKNN